MVVVVHGIHWYIFRMKGNKKQDCLACLAISLCTTDRTIFMLQLQNRHGLFVYVRCENGRKVLIITIFSSHISLASVCEFVCINARASANSIALDCCHCIGHKIIFISPLECLLVQFKQTAWLEIDTIAVKRWKTATKKTKQTNQTHSHTHKHASQVDICVLNSTILRAVRFDVMLSKEWAIVFFISLTV